MADIFKNRYNFCIGLKLCNLEDCTLLLRFYKNLINLPYLGYNTVLRTLETHRKRVYRTNETYFWYSVVFSATIATSLLTFTRYFLKSLSHMSSCSTIPKILKKFQKLSKIKYDFVSEFSDPKHFLLPILAKSVKRLRNCSYLKFRPIDESHSAKRCCIMVESQTFNGCYS